ANGTLESCDVEFSKGSAACVIAASKGYPQKYDKGFEIIQESLPEDSFVYHAGTSLKDGKVVTNGGRVLGITATADTLEEAISRAYAASEKVHFENKYQRSDIGKKALAILNK
ncbi:MAG: phosphoribosylamine--glycine ligase, partial [Clostridia bacterium]|nr:phosphoribosylamine--glycine ligase [Clostridia bacterium]